MRSRLWAVASVVIAGGVALIVACGSSSSPKHVDGKIAGSDAKVFLDGPGSGSGIQNGVGQPCTPGSGGGFTQGTCPPSFVCLSGLSGGNGSWCSKTCVAGSGDQCNVGYTGVDKAGCVYSITVGSGAAMDYCGVICEGSAIGCPSTTCNGMCPGTLTCSAALMDGSGNTVAHACF